MAEVVIKHNELVALLKGDERIKIEALADCSEEIKRLLAELDRIIAPMSKSPEDLSQVVPLLLQLFFMSDSSAGSIHSFTNAIYHIFIDDSRGVSGNFSDFAEQSFVRDRKENLLFLSKYFTAEIFTVERLSELLNVLHCYEFSSFVRPMFLMDFPKDAEFLDAVIRFIRTVENTKEFLDFFRYLYQYKGLLNQKRAIFIMSFPNRIHLEKMFSVVSLIDENFFESIPELADKILEHQYIKEISDILFQYVIEHRDEAKIKAIFSHPNVPVLLAALEGYNKLDSELINSDNLMLVLKNPDPEKQVESLRTDALRKISEAAISPVDVMGKAVTDKSTRVSDVDAKTGTLDAQKATCIIQGRARIFLHASRLNRMSLFSNEGEYKRSRTVLIPEILKKTFPDEFSPDALFPTTTHATSQLRDLLHDGRIYCGNLIKKRSTTSLIDLERGDGMMIFTSPSHNLYNKKQHIVLHVDRMFDAHSGNRGQNVLFKLVDWAALEKDHAYPYTEIVPDLNVRLMRTGRKLVWEVVCKSGQYEVELPQENYVFHVKQGLNRYLSFFLFKVFEDKAIPVAVSRDIYLKLSQLKPEEIIRRFHNVMQANFDFSELDYLGNLELNFMMLSSFQLSETQKINCDAIRDMIERNDAANIEALFSDLETRRLFSQSYFLVKGMHVYAMEKKADAVIEFIESTFENTLRLAEKPSTDSASAADSADGSAVVPVTAVPLVASHLVDTKAHDQLVVDSVSVSQLNQLVIVLREQRDNVVHYINKHVVEVVELISQLRLALKDSLSNVSSLGFMTALKINTIDNERFRLLLSDKENCKILLYLAAVAGDLSGVDDNLSDSLEYPIFMAKNSYTGITLLGFMDGVRAEDERPTNQSFLADLLFNIPVAALFVPNNGYSVDIDFDQDMVQLRVDVYSCLFKNLKSIAQEHAVEFPKKLDDEAKLHEKYDSTQWEAYRERFHQIAKRVEGFSIRDACEDRLIGITAENFINNQLVFTSRFSHFALDAKHLKSILGSNYADFKGIFFDLIGRLVTDSEDLSSGEKAHQNYGMRVMGIQLFNRLLLLEYELAKEAQLTIAPEQVETAAASADGVYSEETCMVVANSIDRNRSTGITLATP